MIILQMSEYIERILHVKSEDLRLYDLSDEENPVLLDNETMTIDDLKFSDGQKLLVESKCTIIAHHASRWGRLAVSCFLA